MPLQMSDAMAAAIAAPVMRPALLVKMQFANGVGYAWSGLGQLVWNGMTFQGVGDFGGCDTIEEGFDVENRGIKLSLSGISPTMAPEVLVETRILNSVTIWLALFDATGAIIPDPVVAWQGYMDQPTMTDSGDQITAEIAVEDDLGDLNRACFRRYTNEDQQQDYPGDTGMQFVAGLQEQITFWGTQPSSINNV